MSDTQYGFDPDELLSDEIVIDKLDAARRQLESAIMMFFHEWDVVSPMEDHDLWMTFFKDPAGNTLALTQEAPKGISP